MTVVLVPVVQQFGATGVLMVGAMAGLVLIALAVARLGRYVRYLPTPVLEGFTAGIAVVIALQQVPAALGVSDAHGEKVWAVAFDAVVRFVLHPRPAALAVALAVAALMLLVPGGDPACRSRCSEWGRHRPRRGHPGRSGPDRRLPQGLPAPSLGFFDLDALGVLLPSALAIAALAALESLSRHRRRCHDRR
ncbi:SulP family inorganic anion transporter [Micromonospora sp. M12]